jgi:chromosome partitioning protein
MEPKMTAKDAADFLGVSLQAINKTLKSKEVDYRKSANRLYFGHDTARTIFDLPIERKKIAFQIVKGGTGKTAMALNFAIRASLYGLRVLCVDLDQQGNLTDLLGVDGDEHACLIDSITDPTVQFKDLIVSVLPGLDLVPSNLDNALLENTLTIKKIRLDRVYSQRIASVEEDYDIVVLDCPPALGSNNAAAALAADLVVAVVDPDRNALKGLQFTFEEVSRIGSDFDQEIPIGIVLNKFDKRTSLSHDTLEMLIKHEVFGPLLYKSYVGTNQQIPNANASLITLFDNLRDSSAKMDFDLLTREILDLDGALAMKKQKTEGMNSAGMDSPVLGQQDPMI